MKLSTATIIFLVCFEAYQSAYLSKSVRGELGEAAIISPSNLWPESRLRTVETAPSAKRQRITSLSLPHHDLAAALLHSLGRRPEVEESHLEASSDGRASAHENSSSQPLSAARLPFSPDGRRNPVPGVKGSRSGGQKFTFGYSGPSAPAEWLPAEASHLTHMSANTLLDETTVGSRDSINQRISVFMNKLEEFRSRQKQLFDQPSQLANPENLPPEITQALPRASSSYSALNREEKIMLRINKNLQLQDYQMKCVLTLPPLDQSQGKGGPGNEGLQPEELMNRLLQDTQPHLHVETQALSNFLVHYSNPERFSSMRTTGIISLLDWNIPPSKEIPESVGKMKVAELVQFFSGYLNIRPPHLPNSCDVTRAGLTEYAKRVIDVSVQLGTRRAHLLLISGHVEEVLAENDAMAPAKSCRPHKVAVEKRAIYSIINSIVLLYAMFTPFQGSHILEMRLELQKLITQLGLVWRRLRIKSASTQLPGVSTSQTLIPNSVLESMATKLPNQTYYRQILTRTEEALKCWLMQWNPQIFFFLTSPVHLKAQVGFTTFLRDCTFVDWIEYGAD